MTRQYNYCTPIKDKPPARNTQLAAVVLAMDDQAFLSSDEIFRRAFRPHDNHNTFKAMLHVAGKRELCMREHPNQRRNNRYALTPKGASVKQALTRGLS